MSATSPELPRPAVPAGRPGRYALDALLPALWQSPGVGVAIWDPHCCFLAVNDEFPAESGRAASALVGHPVTEVLAGESAAVVVDLVAEVTRTGTAVVGRELAGRGRVWQTAWLPLRHGEGDELYAVACVAFAGTDDTAGHLLASPLRDEGESEARRRAEVARRRGEGLVRLAERLGAATTPRDVADVALRLGLQEVGAVAGGVGLLDEAAGVVRVLSTVGGPQWEKIPVGSDLPFVRAAVEGAWTRTPIADVERINARAADWMRQVGSRLAVSVPLRDDRRTVGSLSVQLGGETVDDDLVAHLGTLAALVGQALSRAFAQEQAHTAAAELQAALLPPVASRFADVRVEVGYRASRRPTEVGGDFYDAVALPQGGFLLLLGDVEGHDLLAAAVMAQLRAVLRGYALDGLPPAELLTRADTYLAQVCPPRLATVVAAEVRAAEQIVLISCAGHPPPALTDASGTRLVDIEPDLPLGLGDRQRTETAVPLPARSRLVLFTDGLVETRHDSIGDSIGRLVATLDRLRDRPAAEVVADVLAASPADVGDDAAVVVLDVDDVAPLGHAVRRTLPPVVRSAHLARRWAALVLRHWAVGDDDLGAVLVVVTELVTNAARVSAGDVVVELRLGSDGVLIGVTDDSHRMPRACDATDDDVDGRGLAIVSALAGGWWVEQHDAGGKTVWAKVAVSSEE